VLPTLQAVEEADITSRDALNRLARDQDAVIHLVGILNETRKGDFRRLHVEFPQAVVEACQKNGIQRLLHMSALGADPATGSSLYLRSKGEGENRVHTFGQYSLAVTSFRPSVIFGPDDSFINRFADLLGLCPWPLPYLPLSCPNSRFAPVYIGDLVRAMADSLEDPASFGQRIDLCGPETWTLQQIVEAIRDALGKPCPILPLPDGASRFLAGLLQFMPGKPFTPDNYQSLQTPSVCDSPCPACRHRLSHYLKGLAGGHNRRARLDHYRRQR
jgi:NADH dehydrogenase